MKLIFKILIIFPVIMIFSKVTAFQGDKILEPVDVFDLELANDPQISPDGQKVIYVRTFFDIMTDRTNRNLWEVKLNGTEHRPVTTGNQNDRSPRWSPGGDKLLYISNKDGSNQIYVKWMDTGQTAKLTNLQRTPGNPSWSPDGKWIAFTMSVPEKPSSFAKLPSKPEGAKWAEPAKYYDKLNYRINGAGFLEPSYTHIFLLSADGGTPRQITSGDFNHGSPSWDSDGNSIIFSANRHPDGQYEPLNSEVYEVNIQNGNIKALTDRKGPDNNPVVSPDGKYIAYTGFDDKYQGYQLTKLYVINRDGSGQKVISSSLDRSVGQIQWSQDSKGVFFFYSDQGTGKIGYASLNGKVTAVTENLGGLSLGRPYTAATYDIGPGNRFVSTISKRNRPADLASGRMGENNINQLTKLNEDLLGNRNLGVMEEIWYTSSYDDRRIHGWIVKPPNFDPGKKYPLILEIHGGPFANYGPHFSAEVQLYAAAGYVVLYTNPRGSTSYGEEFGNLIHHSYPGNDYDDLMSGVDALIEKGYVDEDQLFVTGGSGGGVLSAWIVGKTDRFKAAVVAKPVINWYSFVLTADFYVFFSKYWFPGKPWEHPEHYLERSPISLVGNVTTPTMLLTGEVDYRTPISETEQFYQALKLQKVKSAMVRIPEASHGIASRPSYLISKVAHILQWFEENK